MPKKININGSYRLSVCERFIRTHELASGYPMDSHQRGVICTFVDMLNGIGTVNNTDLLTRFIADGTVLFPLCPTNDNDAYLQSFEIDLISGEKMGEYVNMDSTHITVQGALPDASGQYFEVYKSSADYQLMPGYAFAYTQDICDVENVFIFGNGNAATDRTNCIPRATAGDGWSHVRWNGSADSCNATRYFNGQIGVLQRNLTTSLLYTSRSGYKTNVYGTFVSTPYRRNSNRMWFHTTNGQPSLYFKKRISMYCMGVQFTVNEDTAFNDLSQAVEYYQENILSNDTRKWL